MLNARILGQPETPISRASRALSSASSASGNSRTANTLPLPSVYSGESLIVPSPVLIEPALDFLRLREDYREHGSVFPETRRYPPRKPNQTITAPQWITTGGQTEPVFT
jgi:hypothetical protein